MKIQKYIGVRDFYPEDQVVQNFIYDAWRKVANSFGYNEIDTPIIEPLELFTIKSGEEIKSQLYNFTDKGNREITLRPETTPSVARLVVGKQKELKKPIKWFSISQCFRYERPQKGRLRNFVQFNADCLGLDTPLADAENIALAVGVLQDFGLNENDFFIRISNRNLMNSLLDKLCIESRSEVFRIIDKKAKISSQDFNEELKKLGLKQNQCDQLSAMLQLNQDTVKELDKIFGEDNENYSNFKLVLSYLESFGLKNYVKVDLSIIRGLDYYTGTVFELYDKKGELRALAGGGRYDDLVGIFGGEKCSGMGFAMGDVVLGLLLKEKGLLKDLKPNVDYFIGTLGDTCNEAIKLATKLRKDGNSVEIELIGRNIKKQMNYANSINAKKLIILGENEVKSSVVKVKDMSTGTEEEMKL